ncbi:MAG: S-layer homology domain-containing protein [Dialister sp.]|nr:S-layer homology domain-containing protein [Dialister sp.]
MKKILALAAVAALTAGVSAYAANPFSDVSTDDWAYQAVSDLSDQGVVEGYPDGTFRGQRNMTRYELAQIIARLMAREDQLNAEQRATLDKLAGEYADELANLGVRVSNLEKKVGNLYWSGDARMRYQDNAFGDEGWNGRMRINVKAQVNESTTVNGRLTSNMNFKDGEDATTKMDVLNVRHQFGDAVAVKLGRYGNNFGNQGGWLYGSADGFDGAEAQFGLGKFGVAVGFGQFNKGKLIEGKDVLYAKGMADFGVAKLDLNYLKFNDNIEDEVMGVGLVVPVQDFRVFGEYWKNTTADDLDTAWNAGIGYGKLNLKKPGSFQVDVAYNNIERGMYPGDGATGLQTDVLKNLNGTNKADKLKYWNALADVALMKNVYLHGEYAFAVDTDSKTAEDDAWTVSLNYKF